MKSLFTTLVLIFSLVIIPNQSFAQQWNPDNPNSYFQITSLTPTASSVSLTVSYDGVNAINSTQTSVVVTCMNGFAKREDYTAIKGKSVTKSFAGLPPQEDCSVQIFADNAAYNPDTYLQQKQFFTLKLNAGGGTQGGNEGPATPGNTTGEIIILPNSFGMCNSYRWDGTAWKKINVDPFECSRGGTGNTSGSSGSTNTCNVLPPGSQEYEDCLKDQTGQGTLLGGTLPSGPQNGGTTPPGNSLSPGSSSAELTACSKITFDSLLDILIWLKCIIAAAIIPLIFTLAFLYFLWGMVKYIRGAANEKEKEESKKFILWGIIGLTVMVSIWGIVKIVTTTFGFGNTVPELQTDYLKKPETPKNP